jgi:hypothetical protein
VAEICGLPFDAASAAHADHSAVNAQRNTLAQIPPRIAPSIVRVIDITPRTAF